MCVSVVHVSATVFVLIVYLCFSVYAHVWVRVCVSVGMWVAAGARVKPRVRVGAVSVAAAQRAEHHGATGHCAAVFDLQVDCVVVDLQCSYTNRRKRGLLLS